MKLEQASRKATSIRSARVQDYAPNVHGGPKAPGSNCANLWPKGQMSLSWGHKRKWGGKVKQYA